MAARAIRDYKLVSISHIQAVVAKAFGISVADLVGHCRMKCYTTPRFVAIVLCQRFLNISLARTAQRFNRSDHTVILNAMQRMASVVDNVLASEKFQQRSQV
jgi:chromosomal replication initiator protein